jgi:hypothetical protein
LNHFGDRRWLQVQGWISLHRKIRENPIFNDPQLLRLWIICLTEASHKERDQIIGKHMVKLMPGEFVTGRFDIHEMYNKGLSPKDKIKGDKTIFRWLETLEKLDFLTIKKTNKFSVVSIGNWALYQNKDNEMTNEMTNKRPSNDHQMTTNNNVKNEKNVKNDKNTSRQNFKFETPDMELAKLLFNYIQDNGDKANLVKHPNMDKWANEIRLTRERDGKTYDQIKKAIEWSQNHSFWKTVILSPGKLREQYTQLSMKAKQDGEHKAKKKTNDTNWEDL